MGIFDEDNDTSGQDELDKIIENYDASDESRQMAYDLKLQEQKVRDASQEPLHGGPRLP